MSVQVGPTLPTHMTQIWPISIFYPPSSWPQWSSQGWAYDPAPQLLLELQGKKSGLFTKIADKGDASMEPPGVDGWWVTHCRDATRSKPTERKTERGRVCPSNFQIHEPKNSPLYLEAVSGTGKQTMLSSTTLLCLFLHMLLSLY